ncbi:uncharacterized protein LOC116348349 [Contarinia nasturtii]|uniref:uncharacterized protein LOC116348349 n=1 Tax=Contarinia nasturtii TaxID=265458 RepID=UPI0012D42750|nr:uncharacterized protein LOC116348349 [Contarinia nasturtii]
MKVLGISVVAVVLIALTRASDTTNDKENKIKATVTQLECATNAILPIDQKYELEDLWQSVYFPILMHTSHIYGCKDQGNKCVDSEMQSAVGVLINMLNKIGQNDPDAAQDIHDALSSQCQIELPPLPEYAPMVGAPQDSNRMTSFSSFATNFEHILCVVNVLHDEMKKYEGIAELSQYVIESKDVTEKIMECKKGNKGFIQMNVYCSQIDFQIVGSIKSATETSNYTNNE